jgi:TP53 regulating kinase-like protein
MLHKAGIMHGDLTTSNVIVRGDRDAREQTRPRLSLIDFGLAVNSVRVEDYAIDLRLIKETLVGAHSHIHGKAFGAFLRGYGVTLGEAKAALVTKQLAEIEKRGRYTRVE